MNYLHLLWELYKLKRHAAKTKEQIQALQNKKLRHLLEHAYDHSAYYRRTFEAAGIRREQLHELPLSSFPTIDKAIFMEHFDELLTVSDLKQEELRRFDEEEPIEQKLFKGKYHVVHSSGSTGKPGYYIYADEAWNQMVVAVIRAALWNMTMPQILRKLMSGLNIVFIAATDGRYGGAMAVGAGIEGVHGNQLFLDIKNPLKEWSERLQRFKPDMIIGYPSAIKILGELVEKEEVQLDVFRVVSCGEPLGTSLRQYMERVFAAEVVNIYGASESLALGVETNNGEGIVLFDDINYIEVENGTMYLTSLDNFAQPLIRYRLSDQLKLKVANEKSRYPFTKAESLVGRNEDIMWFEDGHGNREFLHPLAIEGFCIEGLRDYQFRQIARNSFEMLAEVTDEEVQTNVRQEMHRLMKQILQEKRLDYVLFKVRFTDVILPDSRTGKKRLVLNLTGNGRFEDEKHFDDRTGCLQVL